VSVLALAGVAAKNPEWVTGAESVNRVLRCASDHVLKFEVGETQFYMILQSYRWECRCWFAWAWRIKIPVSIPRKCLNDMLHITIRRNFMTFQPWSTSTWRPQTETSTWRPDWGWTNPGFQIKRTSMKITSRSTNHMDISYGYRNAPLILNRTASFLTWHLKISVPFWCSSVPRMGIQFPTTYMSSP
jgi:hypothetical protein